VRLLAADSPEEQPRNNLLSVKEAERKREAGSNGISVIKVRKKRQQGTRMDAR
jgi:hypothetical protein